MLRNIKIHAKSKIKKKSVLLKPLKNKLTHVIGKKPEKNFFTRMKAKPRFCEFLVALLGKKFRQGGGGFYWWPEP
jgi:hypothetical protein